MKSKIEKKVYDFFIKSNDFNGIPLRNISNDLGIEYQYSIDLIKDLVADDIITIQSSTNPHIIYSRHYRVDDQLKILEEAKSWKVTAQKIGEVSLLSESTDYPICLYPSPNILKSKRDALEFGNEIYSKELAYGQPQLKPVFFEIEVLERYYNDPRFDFKLKDYSGSIYCKYDENYKPFVREEDEVFLKTFGLGYNSDNKRVVVVYLRYLKDLTPEHQMYWKSKESKKECRMLEVYYQNTIKGSWASSYSIFSAFIGELKCLNEISNIIFSKPLFKEDFDNTNRPKEFTFDSEVSLNHPGLEHITLQHDWIREILNNYGQFNSEDGTPIVISENGEETPGYWSLWEVSAKNSLERKVQYHCFFIADNGKQYAVYANDIWNRLISGTSNFKINGRQYPNNLTNVEFQLEDSLYIMFQNLEAELMASMKVKKENKVNSYLFQKSRINKIGIENIRKSKLRKLEESHGKWLKEFQSMQKIVPGTKHLLTIRING